MEPATARAELQTFTADDLRQRTKAFLFRFVRTRSLENDDDFFALGLLNSLFALQLVLFVEKEFAVQVENEDLDLKNFRTLNAIADFVTRKRLGTPAP